MKLRPVDANEKLYAILQKRVGRRIFWQVTKEFEKHQHAFCKICTKFINISSGKNALKKHCVSQSKVTSATNIKYHPKISTFVTTKTEETDGKVKEGKNMTSFNVIIGIYCTNHQ